MAAAPGASTFADGLSGLLTSLAPLKLLPDADPEVVSNLEAIIVTAVQNAQAGQMAGQLEALGGGPTAPGSAISMPSAPADPMMGGMGGGAGGPMAGAMGMGAPGPGRGLSPRPAPPNPDELRRILNVG